MMVLAVESSRREMWLQGLIWRLEWPARLYKKVKLGKITYE